MLCLVCGAEMTTQRENFRYDACGLPGITLIGVEVSRCPQCGEFEVAIPQIDDLHKAIAHKRIRKTSRLDAAEIRFLRKYLGWSGVDFARHMGVRPETVSRWEQGTEHIGPIADRLLRLLVAARDPDRDYALEWLTTIMKDQPPQTLGIGLIRGKDGWQVEVSDSAGVSP